MYVCIMGWPKHANKHILLSMLYFLWQIQNLVNLFIVTNYSHLRLSFEFNSLNITKNKSDPGNHHFAFKFSGFCDFRTLAHLILYTN